MELVKKSNFGEWEGKVFLEKKRIRKFRFGGNCSQPPAVSVGRVSAFPKNPAPANAINPGICGLANPQTQ